MTSPNASLVKYDNQVAGHDRIMCFTNDDLLIVKPCTQNELTFYETAQQHPEFLEWIPECYGSLRAATDVEAQILTSETDQSLINEGVRSLPDNFSSRSQNPTKKSLDDNLCLENLTHGFVRPCILDLKLGFRLFDCTADAVKRKKMMTNAKGTTIESLGLRISGMKVYDSSERKFTIYPKRFGRTRTEESILDALLAFFFPSSTYGHTPDPSIIYMDDAPDSIHTEAFRGRVASKKIRWLIESYMDDLRDIRNYIAEHPTLQLISTSLLFVYEGDPSAADRVWEQMLREDQETITKADNNDTKTPHTSADFNDDDKSEGSAGSEVHQPRLCDLRIIDFAHSRWDTQQVEPDHDLLRAIDNVIYLLKQCLQRQRSEKL